MIKFICATKKSTEKFEHQSIFESYTHEHYIQIEIHIDEVQKLVHHNC